MALNPRWDATYPMNIREVKEIVEEDTEFLLELIDIFLTHLPDQLSSLHGAISGGDVEAARFHAHRLSGALRNLGAKGAFDKASRIKLAAEAGTFDVVDRLYEELTGEIDILKQYIELREWEKYFVQG